MRRLVVISGTSKIIATFAAVVFALTSIHLAAKAHIASLQREQAWVEKTAVSNQQLALSQGAQMEAGQAAIQLQANVAAIDQRAVASKIRPSETSSAPAADHSTSPAPRRQIIISIADRQL